MVNLEDMAKWYSLSTATSKEKRVKDTIQKSLNNAGLGLRSKIFKIEIPEEKEVQFVDGEKKIVANKTYPGYVFIKMVLDESTYKFVRNIQGVTGFVGDGKKPFPLSEAEISRVLGTAKVKDKSREKVEIELEIGEEVEIKSGPFKNIVGYVVDVNSNGKIGVEVELFGRNTNVTITYDQLAKVV